jgi:DNA-binding NarL/FixJ family response regulator
MPAPDMVVRVVPVERARRYAVALLLEPYESRAPLSDAIRRFRLTNRELEVIALLFSGFGTPAIAARLSISDATVNDHVRRLLGKTDSANRTEMAAKLLGWRGDHRID